MKKLILLLLITTGLFAQSESGGYYIPSKWKLSGSMISPSLSTWTVGLPNGTAASPSLSFTNDINTGLYSVGADQLGLAVNGANMVTVTTTGVGIGTTSPGAKLQVNSEMRVVNGSISVELYSDGATPYIQSFNRGGSPGYSPLHFWGSSYTFNQGNVGIGLANPSLTTTLKSAGTFGWDNGSGTGDVILNRDAANTLAMKNGVNNQLFRLYDEDNTGSNDRYLELGWLTDSSAVLRQAISGTKTSRPLNFTTFSGYSFDGNVGIGTTAPKNALDVRGAISSGNGTIDNILSYDSGVGGVVGPLSNHPLEIFAGGAEKIRITTTGNVGIATTNPLATFHDNGTAMFGAGTGASLTDSSLVVNYSTGSPVLNWYGTDGDTWNIGINTSDGATFNGATTYNFDNVVVNNAPVTLKGYTVATLPAGTVGMTAYVTDATAPTYLGTLTGGGAVVTPVFYNGTAWVSY